MAENLISKGQRITTDKYRDGYDRIFKKVKKVKKEKEKPSRG